MRCDADPRTGVGHVARCVALAEEFAARGARVTFLGDLEVPWARRQVTDRGYGLLPGPTTPDALVAATRSTGHDLVVLDSYVLDPAHGAALRRAGLPVVAIVDGPTHGQVADLYVDANLDADLVPVPLPPGAGRLAGLPYALIRDAVRARRPPCPPAARDGVPRVLCFFGGTDALGAAPTVARLLVATGRPFAATVVAARPPLAAELAAVVPGSAQSLTVIPPSDDLPSLVVRADLVVGAAGSSTWELLCLGAAAAVVAVADNQRWAHDRVVARGLAVGLGPLETLADGGSAFAVDALRELLARPRHRAELAARGWRAVDGRGRARVTDAAVRLAGIHRRTSL
jgi:spore coat polysaccharide biosynthesis predicted glycosyltransferase SpsG